MDYAYYSGSSSSSNPLLILYAERFFTIQGPAFFKDNIRIVEFALFFPQNFYHWSVAF